MRMTSWLMVGALVVACTAEATDRKLGDSCDADGQCTGGLSCKQNFVGNACTRKTCTRACSDDAECQTFDAKSACFKGCEDEKICMRTP